MKWKYLCSDQENESVELTCFQTCLSIERCQQRTTTSCFWVSFSYLICLCLSFAILPYDYASIFNQGCQYVITLLICSYSPFYSFMCMFIVDEPLSSHARRLLVHEENVPNSNLVFYIAEYV